MRAHILGIEDEDTDIWNAYVDNLHRSHVQIGEEEDSSMIKEPNFGLLFNKIGL